MAQTITKDEMSEKIMSGIYIYFHYPNYIAIEKRSRKNRYTIVFYAFTVIKSASITNVIQKVKYELTLLSTWGAAIVGACLTH